MSHPDQVLKAILKRKVGFKKLVIVQISGRNRKSTVTPTFGPRDFRQMLAG